MKLCTSPTDLGNKERWCAKDILDRSGFTKTDKVEVTRLVLCLSYHQRTMRTTKDWKLPVPEETEDGFDWKPVVRVGELYLWIQARPRRQRCAFTHSEELNLLEKAKKYLKQYSYEMYQTG